MQIVGTHWINRATLTRKPISSQQAEAARMWGFSREPKDFRHMQGVTGMAAALHMVFVTDSTFKNISCFPFI
jgi:hypothetical protein